MSYIKLTNYLSWYYFVTFSLKIIDYQWLQEILYKKVLHSTVLRKTHFKISFHKQLLNLAPQYELVWSLRELVANIYLSWQMHYTENMMKVKQKNWVVLFIQLLYFKILLLTDEVTVLNEMWYMNNEHNFSQLWTIIIIINHELREECSHSLCWHSYAETKSSGISKLLVHGWWHF
jgi:hypothetical protein